jgi:DNA repair ATPase RecN
LVIPDSLGEALKLTRGARYYKCALQVNPFNYLVKQKKPLAAPDEATYNSQVVARCKAEGVHVIATADHFRIRTSETLLQAATGAGLMAFPGYEANSSDGVHFLCIFDRSRDVQSIDRIIGECGINDDKEASPIGTLSSRDILDSARRWRCVCVAAHIDAPKGLLQVLSGQAAVQVWTSPTLLAVAVNGQRASPPDRIWNIVDNVDPNYRRGRQVAVLNARDICAPDDLARPESTCFVRMSDVSVEGLRQAFLDPESRVRLSTDPAIRPHNEVEAITWEGGFLDKASIHLSENFNVLIGGRGTGKSTVVESLRYVFDIPALGEEAQRAHLGIVQQVLKPGTKVSVLVRVYHPTERTYVVERTVPNQPVVRDDSGSVIKIKPSELLPTLEVYGQHEIAELARSPTKLTSIIARFTTRDAGAAGKKLELLRRLEATRLDITQIDKELVSAEEQLQRLPGLEETTKRYEAVGFEARVAERSKLVVEEQLLKDANEKLQSVTERVQEARKAATAFTRLSRVPDAHPEYERLAEGVDRVFSDLASALAVGFKQLDESVSKARLGLVAVRENWSRRRDKVIADYDTVLKELQLTRVDAQEFIRLRQMIESLRRLHIRSTEIKDAREKLWSERMNLLAAWEDCKTSEFQSLQTAARSISQALAEKVRVSMTYGGDRAGIFELLRSEVGGRLQETFTALQSREDLSPGALAAAIRAGPEDLINRFGLLEAQAKKLAGAPLETSMKLEELDPPHTTSVQLNVGAPETGPTWRELQELSTGQRATAVLLLLLLESDSPLVVDQPEDDLDNRFISETVVPTLRQEKPRRQFIFTTHNANVPVLGDAELIVGLSAVGDASGGRAEIRAGHRGSIDDRSVRELVEEVLEGGRDAFEMRREKYGY